MSYATETQTLYIVYYKHPDGESVKRLGRVTAGSKFEACEKMHTLLGKEYRIAHDCDVRSRYVACVPYYSRRKQAACPRS